ncbi:MAG: protein phosphatase CheZ [Alphaproteobacteria bacterium]|nr:protein phosphatase CheZ [Alphaproteobacteria bacterium]
MTGSGVELEPKLRREFSALFRYFDMIRADIAALYNPKNEDGPLPSISQQLDAISAATEEAADEILQAAEVIGEQTSQLAGVKDEQAINAATAIDGELGRIYQACSFQDITGQRLTKVMRSVGLIEERIGSLIRLLGEEAVAEAAPQEDADAADKDEEADLLEGPALNGEGVSQDDIDKMFD